MPPKQITHQPEVRERLKKLSDARRVITESTETFERYNKLLHSLQDKLKNVVKSYGSTYVPVYDANNRVYKPQRVDEMLQPEIDEINRLIG